MKIILVRHGQTDENIKGIIQSPTDKLTAIGQKQAEIVAQKLKDKNIDIVYVSDFLRTKQTAEAILKFHPKAEVIYTKELREKNAGIFIGKPLEEQKKAREESGLSFYEFYPKGGESLLEMQKRVVRFFKKITEGENDNKTVLVVTHRGPIIALLLYLRNESFERWPEYKIDNTEVINLTTPTEELRQERAKEG